MSRRVARTTLRGMTNLPPPAEELRFLDAELRQLDVRRATLLRRRAWLVHTLQATAARQPALGPGTAPVGPPAGTGAAARRPEATAPGVQNVLLVLGGVLLTIAAIAFTLVSWGHLGIAGRALVLGALTVGALGAPVALLRRGLRSTAEAVAALGTALTVLDAYALHEVAFPGTDGAGYTATASAVLAALWAVYGVRLGLRHPLPLAVATAHLPLLLGAIAVGAGPYTLTAVSLATAAGGAAVALRAALLPVRIVAVTGALGTGAAGVLSAGWLCWVRPARARPLGRRRSCSWRPRSRWWPAASFHDRRSPWAPPSRPACAWSPGPAGCCG